MIRVYDETGNAIQRQEHTRDFQGMVALGRASITPTPGSDHGPKREEPSDVRKSGTRPTRKKRDAPPLFPPELKTIRIAGPFGRIGRFNTQTKCRSGLSKWLDLGLVEILPALRWLRVSDDKRCCESRNGR